MQDDERGYSTLSSSRVVKPRDDVGAFLSHTANCSVFDGQYLANGFELHQRPCFSHQG
jgi:hypothetical protein